MYSSSQPNDAFQNHAIPIKVDNLLTNGDF